MRCAYRAGGMARGAAADPAGCAQCGARIVGHTTVELGELESLAGSLKTLCERPGGNYRIRLQMAGAESN